ncbi:SDR family oxidoreductase [Roseicella aerolata]|uniref:SDR family oxidoreductase n=1 Tax=Roseicella aerolata TaxID=2883479 RepID=A0A9X1IDD9_9PROT|nr:SDR family oxidoreductase [Roseicella aerolata]MCB4821015.1 SDR family oxidoreductase [Roseicella aerolata]
MTERRHLLTAAALGLAAGTGEAGAQPRPGPLAGRAALVTGAARGIGRATAILLAQQGADIALLDIARPEAIPQTGYRLASAEDLAEAARLVAANGVRALPLAADLRDRAATEAAIGRAVGELGGLDILVANAGINVSRGAVTAVDAEAWQALLDVNLTGTWHSVRAALPGLRRRGGGRIVLVTSIQARRGAENSGAYAATKWGLTGLMKSLAHELGPEGITVNAVAPTTVSTVMVHGGRPREEPADPREAGKRLGYLLPRPMLQPEEIAQAIAYLCGPGAGAVSGVTLDVNAGQSASLSA